MMNKFFISIIAIFIMFVASATFATNEKPSAKKDLKKDENIKEKDVLLNLGNFTYTSEGKRDPFQSVLIMKAKAGRDLKSPINIKRHSELLEYELEALKLVGVLKSDKGMIAMMEDTQGKGVFFRKNDKLNKNMWVDDINSKCITLAYKLKGETKKVVVEIPEKK